MSLEKKIDRKLRKLYGECRVGSRHGMEGPMAYIGGSMFVYVDNIHYDSGNIVASVVVRQYGDLLASGEATVFPDRSVWPVLSASIRQEMLEAEIDYDIYLSVEDEVFERIEWWLANHQDAAGPGATV